MTPATRSLLLITLSLVTAAHVSASFAQSSATTPQRGQLLENPPAQLGVYTPSDLISRITDGTISRWLLRRAFSPHCSVVVYQLQYETIGGQGEPTTASGALMIPSGPDPTCQSPRPIVLYAHGKRNLRFFNIADLSGQTNYEGLLLALALAGDGYIVVAPNYAGYDTSTLPYHPFLNATQQSADMMDALAAARAALPVTGIAENHKLFVTGYSEGGYVAMATQRELQAAGMTVTASAPMSGPYALSAFADAMFLGFVGAGAVEEFILLESSYQHAYGNLHSSPTEIFEAKYASVESLLPATAGIDTLIAQGQLPESAVFSSTPPAPEFAALTPPITGNSYFDQVFAGGFGIDHLITNSYRLSYLQDALSAPDGGFPDTTTGLPPSNPANTLRLALKKNDLRNWAPSSPTLLCAGDADPVVFFLNTQLMEAYWAMNAPDSPVLVLDVDAPAWLGGPYQNLRERFEETKTLLEWIEGPSAVIQHYHDVLVPAFCVQAARSFFNGF
jgi:pimeloyl-ACP methyl ester carboxylesterase